MLKKILILLLFLIYSGMVFAETGSNDFIVYPAGRSDFKVHFTLDKVFATVYPKPYGQEDPDQDSSINGSGVEISLDCPWFQLDGNPLRQQISYVYYHQTFQREKDQVLVEEQETQESLEFNPQYLLPMGKIFAIGFGPGFGFLRTTPPGMDNSTTYFTLQYGASFVINLGMIHLAVEYRKQEIQGSVGKYLNNDRRVFKVGINF